MSTKGCNKRRIAIWGAGSAGIRFYNQYKDTYDIKCFYDNDPSKLGTNVCGIPVEQYDPNHPLFIVIASEYSKEIQDQLYSYGLLPYKDFLYSGQCNNDTYLMRYSDLRSVLTSYAPVQGYVPYIFAHKKLAVVYGTIYVFGGVLFRH